MPRLPGPEALGGLPSMRSGARPAQLRGSDPIAEGLGRVGAGMVALSNEQREREEALQAAEADARLTTGLTDLRRRFDTDPDWQTFQPRFMDEATRVQEEAGALITSPRMRERWQPRSDIAVSGAFDHVRGRQDRMRGEHEFDRLDRTLGDLGSAYVTAPDDATRETIHRNAMDTLELGRRTGVVPPARIRDLTTRRIHGMVEADALARHSAGDGYAALIELREGDARAQQPSSGQVSELGLAYMRRLQDRPAGQTPTQVAAADRRLRGEASQISGWITENVTTPLTQLQHDALVGVGVRRGREALEELAPSIETGNWESVASAVRAGGLFAAETAGERPARGAPSTQRQRTAHEVAQDYLGTNERQHTEALSEFFRRSGGQRLSPAETAWCAAFVNAALGATGAPGTGTLAARDFLRVGTATQEPQVGDIVVLTRGDPAGWQGHVGFYMGRDDQGRVRVLGGNQGRGEVSVENFDPSRVLGYRTPPRAGSTVPGVDLAQYQTQDPRSEEMADMLIGQAPSSRYRNLPPERRRVVANRLSESLRNETRTEIESDLESIRRTGEPRPLPDGTTWISRAPRILVPNQAALVSRRVQEAYAEFRALQGLTDKTPEQMEARLEELDPSRMPEGGNYAVAARVRDRAARHIGQINQLRQRDSALSVSGTRITGARGSVRADANGQLHNVPAEDDLLVRPAQEVTAAFQQLQRRYAGNQQLQIAFTPDGEPVATPVPGQADPNRVRPQTLLLTDPRLTPDDRRLIIEARFAAMSRLQIPEHSRRVLRQDEAASLLDMPPNAADMPERDFNRRLRAAADRAMQLFGPRYARAAFNDAWRFRNLTGERRNEAATMGDRLPRAGYLSEDDLGRSMDLYNRDREGADRLDREEAMWRYGIPTFPMTPELEDAGFGPVYRYGAPPAQVPPGYAPPSNLGVARTVAPGLAVAYPKPAPQDISDLQRFPQLQDTFDLRFGPGAAAAYLQGQQPRR